MQQQWRYSGKRKDEMKLNSHQSWWFSEFHPPLNANVLFCRFFQNITLCMTKLRVLVLCFSCFTDKPHLPLQFLKPFWIQRNSHFSFEKKRIQNQRNLQFQFFSKTSNARSFIEGFTDWFFWCGRFNNYLWIFKSKQTHFGRYDECMVITGRLRYMMWSKKMT